MFPTDKGLVRCYYLQYFDVELGNKFLHIIHTYYFMKTHKMMFHVHNVYMHCSNNNFIECLEYIQLSIILILNNQKRYFYS